MLLFAKVHLFNILTAHPRSCFSFSVSGTRWLFKGRCSPAFNCWNLGLEVPWVKSALQGKDSGGRSPPSGTSRASEQLPGSQQRKKAKLGERWAMSNTRLCPGGRSEQSHSLTLGAEITLLIYLLTPSVGACGALSGSSVLQESG